MRSHRSAPLGSTVGLALLLVGCGGGDDTVTGTSSGTGTPSTSTSCATVTANGAQVVCLANVFTATLSTSQQTTLQPALSATTAVRWSNLPCGSSCRNGLQFSTLSATQLSAALGVAQAALSSAGYATLTAWS